MEIIKSYWKSKTIYRKIILIFLVFHFAGFFLLPLATLYGSASTLNQWMGRLGIGEFPKRLTFYALIRLIKAMGGSDGIFYSIAMIACAVVLLIQLLGKRRASYVVTLIIWGIFSIFEYPAISTADSIRVYEFCPAGVLLILSGAAISVAAFLGIILEVKAQSRMAQRAAMAAAMGTAGTKSVQNVNGQSTGGMNFQIDPEKVEKLKEQAGNIAEISAAVAKKAAKGAVKGLYRATDAVKGFVEEAKSESSIPSQPVFDGNDDGKTVMLSQSAPKVKEETVLPKQIPQIGTITGIKGMFTGAQIPLVSGEELIIGRAADVCHIILEGVEISRKHCVVVYDGTTGNYMVTDSSGNGTFTGNGGRLPSGRMTVLTPGTIICVGSEENAFRLGEMSHE